MNKSLQMSLIRVGPKLKLLTILMVALLGGLGVYAVQGLYADGAYFLLKILSNKTYWDFDAPRAFAQRITQAPVVWAMALGIRDLNALTYLHSVGLTGIPSLIWIFSLLQLKKTDHFWVILLAYCATYLSSNFFAIGEYNLTYALASYCLAIFLKNHINTFDQFSLVAASLSLVCSYEAMVFLGPILLLILGYRYRLKKMTWPTKLTFAITALFFLLAILVAINSLLFPRAPENLAGAMSFGGILLSGHFYFLFSILIMYFATFIFPLNIRRLIAGLATGLSVIYTFNPGLWSTPALQYEFRAMSGILLFLIFLITFFISVYQKLGAGTQDTLPQTQGKEIVFALFLALLIPNILQVYHFSLWIKNVETVVLTQTQWIPIDKTTGFNVGGDYGEFNSAWSNPALSIILKGDQHGGLLNNSAHQGWQPFDPQKLKSNPVKDFKKNRKLFIYLKD